MLHNSGNGPSQGYLHHQITLEITIKLGVMDKRALPDTLFYFAEIKFTYTGSFQIFLIYPHKLHNIDFIQIMILINVIH